MCVGCMSPTLMATTALSWASQWMLHPDVAVLLLHIPTAKIPGRGLVRTWGELTMHLTATSNSTSLQGSA